MPFRPSYRRRYNSKGFRSNRPQNSHRSEPRTSSGRDRRGYRRYYHQQPSRYAYVEEPDSEIDPTEEDEEDEIINNEEYDEVPLEYYDDEEADFDEADFDEEDFDEEDFDEDIYYDSEEQPLEYYEEDFSDGNDDTIEDLPIYFYNENGADADDVEIAYVDSDGNEFIIDNEDLEEAILDEAILEELEANGRVHDLNNEIVEYYDENDGLSSSDSESSSESDLEIDSLNDSSDSSDSSDDSDSSESDSSDDGDSSDSSDDSGVESLDSDVEQEIKDDLLLELIRREFEEELVSSDELTSEDESSDLGSEPEYFEVDTEDEENSEDEGITIYKSLVLPEDIDDEDVVFYDDLGEESDEATDNTKLLANDSDDEFQVVDLTEDLENSLDYKLEEIDANTYKLNVRFPSLVKDELKIDFLKNENELVIRGKLNLNDADIDEEVDEVSENEEEEEDSDADSFVEELKEKDNNKRAKLAAILAELEKEQPEEDSEEDEDFASPNEEDGEDNEEEEEEEEEEFSGDEDTFIEQIKEDLKSARASRKERIGKILADLKAQEENYNEESDNDFDANEWKGVESEGENQSSDDSEESSSDEDEEIQEDEEELAKQYKNQEVHFEKHFQFDKVIKFNKIQARFVGEDELELIIPNENKTVDDGNCVSIDVEPLQDDDSSITDEIDNTVAIPSLKEVEDVIME